MFGGSPIRVAVPPIFEAIASEIRRGTGLNFIISARERIIGLMSNTVVTLSSTPERTAVVKVMAKTVISQLPLVILRLLMAIYWKIPVFERTPTTIIIPINRPIVLKSIKRTATSAGRSCVTMRKAAPRRAATLLESFPVPIIAKIVINIPNVIQAWICIFHHRLLTNFSLYNYSGMATRV
ncbi:hypothetical protein SDC9_127179 [bioreactor metagenome]|uniref:Uncharacterized protein n=1 Tax=bioreactor metagenome TaxID=1076179 RepID=A0A645CT72_9ZZZZ